MNCKVFGSSFVLLLFLSTLCVEGRLPGFKAVITQGGVDYIKDVAVPILLSQLSSVDIPDIDGSTSTPVGTISYDLTSIVLDSLTLPSTSVTIASSGLTVAVSDVTAHVHLDWHYRENSWPHVSDSGDADISVSSTSVQVSLALQESNQEPQVSVTACSVSVGSLDIDLHGGASWLYNIFVSVFSDQIKSEVQDTLQQQIQTIITTQGNQALSTVPVTEPVSDTVEIDFGLIADPICSPPYILSEHVGEFYVTKNQTEAPFTPVALPDTGDSEMLNLFIADYVVMSASYVYYTTNQMVLDLYPSDIPSNVPAHLNTTFFKSIVPNLYQKYPNMNMSLHVYATKIPSVNFTSGGINITAWGNVDVNVLTNASSSVTAFTLGVVAWLNGTASISTTGNLTGEVEYIKSNLSLVSTSIGDVDTSYLTDLVNLLLVAGVVPEINKSTQRGFLVPTVDGVSLVSPTLAYNPGYISVSTNISYSAPQYLFDRKPSRTSIRIV